VSALLPMPHRVALLCPRFVFDERDRRMGLAAALLHHTLGYELLLEHPVVAMAQPSLDLYQDPSDGSLLAPGHPKLDEHHQRLFEVHQLHELLTFTLDLRQGVGGSRGVLRALRHDGETVELEAPAGIPLSVVFEGCLLRWLRTRRFAMTNATLPEFDIRTFVLGCRHLRTRLNSYDGSQESVLAALEDKPRRLTTTVYRAMMLAWDMPAPNLILADRPDDLWAGFHNTTVKVRRRTAERGELRQYIGRAPQWGKPRLAMLGGGVPRDEQLLHQSVAATLLPSHPRALTNYASSLVAMGRADEAFRFANRATRLYPDELKAQLAALNALRVIGRPGQAFVEAQRRLEVIEDLVQAGRFKPDDVKVAAARLLRSLIYMDVGRRESAIGLRHAALESTGKLPDWDRQAKVLENWQAEPDAIARAYARASHYRGMPGGVKEGFRRAVPARGTDLGKLVSALLDCGEDRLATFIYAQHRTQRLGRHAEARLAGARALIMKGELQPALEQLHIVQLRLPQSKKQTNINRLLRLGAALPAGAWVSAIARRRKQGARRLAWMAARDAADFVPGLAEEAVVLETLGLPRSPTRPRYDARWLAPLRRAMQGESVADATELDELMSAGSAAYGKSGEQQLAAADGLVNEWLEVVGPPTAERASVWLYALGASLCRYFGAATTTPTPLAGAFRQIAAAALDGLEHVAPFVPRELLAPLLGGLATAHSQSRGDNWHWDRWMLRVERALDISGRVGHLSRVSGGVGMLDTTLRSDVQVSFELRLADSYAQQAPLRDAACELYERCFRAIGEAAATPLAEMTLAAKPLEVALDALWTAATAAPGIAEPRLALAHALFRSGDGDHGVEVLAEAARLLPDDQRASVLSQYQAAFLSAVDVPFDPVEARNLGLRLLSEGRAGKALPNLEWAAANADSDEEELQVAVGRAMAQLGHVVEATGAFSAVDVERGPSLAAYALTEAGHDKAARAAFQAASLGYTTPDEWLECARGLYGLKQYKQAIEAFEKAEEMEGDLSTQDLWQLAIAWARMGDLSESEIAARQLIAMAFGDKTAGVTGWTLMARIELTRGSSGSAQRALEKALELDPDAQVELETVDPIEMPELTDQTADKAFEAVKKGEWMKVPRQTQRGDWRLARAQLVAARYEAGGTLPADHSMLADIIATTRGSTDLDAVLCRVMVLEQREAQTYGIEPPVPPPMEMDSISAFQTKWRAAVNAWEG